MHHEITSKGEVNTKKKGCALVPISVCVCGGGEAFQWNSHFVQIKKSPCHGERVSWERGAGLFVVGKGVDIPQDEVGHCSPSPLKRAF